MIKNIAFKIVSRIYSNLELLEMTRSSTKSACLRLQLVSAGRILHIRAGSMQSQVKTVIVAQVKRFSPSNT